MKWKVNSYERTKPLILILSVIANFLGFEENLMRKREIKLKLTAEETQRKAGITASRHGLFGSGYSFATMRISIRSKLLVSKS